MNSSEELHYHRVATSKVKTEHTEKTIGFLIVTSQVERMSTLNCMTPVHPCSSFPDYLDTVTICRMYNVVVAKGDKAYAEITNAKMIYKNFGYSPEQITQSSVKCQDLGKGYRYFPWSDGCVINSSQFLQFRSIL